MLASSLPLNPTAKVFTRLELGVIAEFCVRRNVIAVCDDVWEHVVFDGRTHTPLASLSRSLGGLRGRSLVLCLPGSPRGAAESLDAVADILDHAQRMAAGRTAHD